MSAAIGETHKSVQNWNVQYRYLKLLSFKEDSEGFSVLSLLQERYDMAV